MTWFCLSGIGWMVGLLLFPNFFANKSSEKRYHCEMEGMLMFLIYLYMFRIKWLILVLTTNIWREMFKLRSLKFDCRLYLGNLSTVWDILEILSRCNQSMHTEKINKINKTRILKFLDPFGQRELNLFLQTNINKQHLFIYYIFITWEAQS